MKPERKATYKQLLLKIEAAINGKQKTAIRASTNRLRSHRVEAFEEVPDFEAQREELRSIKRATIQEIERHLQKLTENVIMKGGRVFRAKTRDEAVQYVLKLALEREVELIVKSKSMTTEELELNHVLEEKGIRVVDTDLGERIVQLAREKPVHIIAPAIHKTREEVAALFSEASGKNFPTDPVALTQEVRKMLREDFLNAQMGITGVNIAVAETGTIVVVTNEGNARLTSALPPLHVAVMGMEKVIPTIGDAIKQLKLLSRSGTGQKFTSYISFISGPNKGIPGYNNGNNALVDREFHLVILDNGRNVMREKEEFRDALNCIKCGACLNVCPTYSILGGHVFGYTYTGPIGIPWTAFTEGMEKAGEFAPLCIGCGLCEDVCPVKIEIPKMIIHVKHHDAKKYGQPKANKFIINLEEHSRRASQVAPVANLLLSNRIFRYFMEKVTGIDRRRPFPKYSRKTFRHWFKTHPLYHSKSGLKIAYFHDVYANYNDPEVGKSVVQILEKNDCEVVAPPQKHSGMPLLSYGNTDEATEIMKYNVSSLAEYVRKGYKVVSAEPTAAFCLKKLYPDFLGTSDAKLVAQNSYEFFEFLMKLHREGRLDTNFKKLNGMKVGYHSPCHTKSIFKEKPVARIMELIGLNVKEIDYGCCGIAGTYGYKAGLDGFDLSIEVGKGLFEEVMKLEYDAILTESSVCRVQIETGTPRKVLQPIRLLREAYSLSSE